MSSDTNELNTYKDMRPTDAAPAVVGHRQNKPNVRRAQG